jgi:CRISPR/Cas system-associated exonuclease Cas4 (RecB family)
MAFEFEILKTPPDHISISQVRTYGKCQVQWYFSKCTDTKVKYSDRMLLGNMVHGGLAQANMLRMASAPLVDSIVEDAAMKEFLSQTERSEYEYTIWKSEEAIKKQSTKILQRAVGELDRHTGIPMLVEHPIGDESLGGTEIVFSSGHKLVGYVDLIDTEGSVYDFKVGKAKKTQADADQDLQMRLYAYAIHGIPNDPIKIALLSVDSGEKTINNSGTISVADSLCHGWQCEQAYDVIDAATTQMKHSVENQSFMPNTEGWHCGPRYCDYWHTCPFGGKHE